MISMAERYYIHLHMDWSDRSGRDKNVLRRHPLIIWRTFVSIPLYRTGWICIYIYIYMGEISLDDSSSMKLYYVSISAIYVFDRGYSDWTVKKGRISSKIRIFKYSCGMFIEEASAASASPSSPSSSPFSCFSSQFDGPQRRSARNQIEEIVKTWL